MKDAALWTRVSETRTCPLCGGIRHTVASQRMQHGLDLTTVVCQECSFVFTNPLPARETYERFYREAYADYYGHITPKPICAGVTTEPAQFTAKFNLLAQKVTLSGSRLLEVGPGNGLFLWWARHRGCEALGVEPSPEFCSVLASAGLPYLQGVLSDVRPETHGLFDIIFMSHVLEHFYDPNEALQHCRALLKETGILAVEVPNILKPFRSLDRYFLRYVHPSNFSPRTLHTLLDKQGFRSFHTDAGGNNWRLPQNLFVIAEKQQAVPEQRLSAPGEADRVLHALQSYRRQWCRSLALKWHARDFFLPMKKMGFRLGRPIKRRLMGIRGE
jgi:2-polyprenyl-3-methyl-5-hydroxy-6-metoxy-1,4-benzoquinol methylase